MQNHRALHSIKQPCNNAYLKMYKKWIKTHGSESRGQGGSTLRRPLDERT